jgi:hypothetical protein
MIRILLQTTILAVDDDWSISRYSLEFIPIKPLVAMAAAAVDSYATHSRLP